MPGLLAENKIYLAKSTIFSNIQTVFDSYAEKYFLVFNQQQILPFIHCGTCKLFRNMYKLDPHGKVRNNSRTNIENHKCKIVKETPKIAAYKTAVNMSLPVRQAITGIVSDEIAKRPTMSIQASTDFWNAAFTRVQPLLLNIGHPIKSDISRQTVSKEIIEKGQNLINRNLEFFNQNLTTSCIIFDHWSQHGKNFFSAIGRTAQANMKFKNYVLGFFEASPDKSAIGYLGDLKKLLKSSTNVEIPLMSDNCASMVKVGNITKKFKKVHCAAHKLATLNDRIHKLPNIAQLDNCLNKINGFFNYRHQKFNLNLKPKTSTSSTRSWRSHHENYSISIRNFDQYDDLRLMKPDFPKLPNKANLDQVSEFQKKLCSFFDILENKDSDLLDQLNIYIKLSELALDYSCTRVIGDTLETLMNKKSTFDAFISDDTLAYCYLSKINFKFVFRNLPKVDSESLLKRAKDRVKFLMSQLGNAVPECQLETGESAIHNDDLFEKEVEEVKDTANQNDDSLTKFESLKGLNRAAFWLKSQNDFPSLFMVYLHLRSIPASNLIVERGFSTAGRIFDELKSSTSSESIEAQVAICLDNAFGSH